MWLFLDFTRNAAICMVNEHGYYHSCIPGARCFCICHIAVIPCAKTPAMIFPKWRNRYFIILVSPS